MDGVLTDLEEKKGLMMQEFESTWKRLRAEWASQATVVEEGANNGDDKSDGGDGMGRSTGKKKKHVHPTVSVSSLHHLQL
jgi:hypothetical protein